MAERIALCFVCAGNICRSPTAEGVFRHLAQERGLLGAFEIDSAATGRWHIGQAPDARARSAAAARGIALEGISRQFLAADFARFEHVLAMDHQNRQHLEELAPSATDRKKVELLRAFDPLSPPNAEVPDPYYGGAADYEIVVDLCLAACKGLLARLSP